LSMLACLGVFHTARTGAPTLGDLPPDARVLLGLTLVVAVIVLGAAALLYWPRTSGRLRIGEGAVFWKERILFRRDAVTDVIAYTNGSLRGAHHGVRLRTRWRTVYFEVADEGEADAIVAASGKDSGQSTLGFVGPTGWTFGGVFAAQGLIPTHSMFLRFLVCVLVSVCVSQLWMRLVAKRWTVGTDGLLVRSGLRRSRFVPYRDIVSMTVTGRTLDITLRDWGHVTMSAADDVAASARPVIGVRALKRRIEQARTHASQQTSGANVTELLARGDRDVAAWIAELTELDARAATYRVASVPRDALWSTLEDAAQPAQVRAAAATALRPRLGDTERARLRVVAGACASPKLRVAFEAAGADDEESLSNALSALSEAEAAHPGLQRRLSRS